MKIILFLITAFSLMGHHAYGMKATVDIFHFQTAEGRNYVEIFKYIVGNSVKRQGSATPKVEIMYLISRDSVVVSGDKYNLVMPVGEEAGDLLDLRRHFVEPGEYKVTIRLRDLQDSTGILQFRRDLVIEKNEGQTEFSDIQLLSVARKAEVSDKWSRNGIQSIPLPFNFSDEDASTLNVYTELYNAEARFTGNFYVEYAILNPEQDSAIVLKVFERSSPQALIPLLKRIDVSGLVSGRYILRVGAYDRDKTLITEKSVEFARSNPKADLELLANSSQYLEESFVQDIPADSLEYVLRAVAARVSQSKVGPLNYLVRKGGEKERRLFLHQYWLEVGIHDPEKAYREFMKMVRQVDVMFTSGFRHGFETDRGRIWLRYGAPNDIVAIEDEPSAPPYEIWIYYEFPVPGQQNSKFLFYAPELANSYMLLHSTCECELQNPAWEQILYRDAYLEADPGDFIEARPVEDNFYRRAREFFTDF